MLGLSIQRLQTTRRSRLVTVWTAAGVVLIAILGETHASPYRPVIGHISMSSAHWIVGALVGVSAMVFVTAGFLLALRESWRGHMDLATILKLGVVFQLIAICIPVILSRDIYSYAMYGRMLSIYHVNPYVVSPVDFSRDPFFQFVGPLWRDSQTVYGPLFSLISGVLASGAKSIGGLTFLFKLISGAAAIATMFLSARLAQRMRPGREAFAAVLIGWNPVVLFQVIGGGHNDTLIGLAVVLALWLLVNDRVGWQENALTRNELAATAVLTLATLIKAVAGLPLVLLLIFVVARRQGRDRLVVLVAHVGVAVALTAALAWPFMQTGNPSLGLIDLATHAEWPALPLFFQTVLASVADYVVGPHAAEVSRILVQVAFLAMFAGAFVWLAAQVARRAPSLSLQGLGVAWGWAFLIFMLTIPQLLPWYLIWLLPLAWLMPKVPRAVIILMGVVLGLTTELGMAVPPAHIFQVLITAGHFVLPPVFLALLVYLLVCLRRESAQGRILESGLV